MTTTASITDPSSTGSGAGASAPGSSASAATEVCNCPICRAAAAAAAAGQSLADYMTQYYASLVSPMGDTSPSGTLDMSLASPTPMYDLPTLQGTGSKVSVYSIAGTGSTGFDEVLDGLYKWGGTYSSTVSPVGTGATVTYSFPGVGATWGIGYTEAQSAQYAPFSASQQAAARAALQLWANVANITFVEVADTASDVGQIRFALTDPSLVGTSASTYTPGPTFKAGDVWFSNSATYATMTAGNLAFKSLVHEIGHALGLTHPQDTPVIGDPSVDWQGMTVMSYRSAQGQGSFAVNQSLYVSGPMYEDIGAVQYLYGANNSYNNTDTVYSWTPGQSILQTIWDAGGTDTIDASNQTTASLLDLRSGNWNQIGSGYDIFTTGTHENRTVMIAAGAVIENANGGSASDTIDGNSVTNVLTGNDGDDTLEGFAGNDTLTGGSGTDVAVFTGNRANYTVTRGAGTFTVKDNTAVDGTDTLSGIETLQFNDVSVSAVSVPVALNDFNADGLSDYLWQNTDGSLARWYVNSSYQITSPAFLPGPSTDWNLKSTADFNGDGRIDYLWQNNITGSWAEWYVDDASVITASPFLPGPSSDWNLLSTADLNGDGRADFLWRNTTTGNLAEWNVDNSYLISSSPFLPSPSSDWNFLTTGDFNADGRADILWQNPTLNVLAEWTIDNSYVISGSPFIIGPSSDWTFKGVADFNGDGKSDILWQNSADNSLARWYLDGSTITSYAPVLPGPSSDWALASMADFNGDGRADLLWRNSGTGNLAYATMDDGSTITYSQQLIGPSSDWTLKSVATAGQIMS